MQTQLVLQLILIILITHKIHSLAIHSLKITEAVHHSLITTAMLDPVDIVSKLISTDSLMKIAKVFKIPYFHSNIKKKSLLFVLELCFYPRCNFAYNSQRRQCYQCSVTYDSEGNVLGSGDADCMRTMDPALE